MTVTWLVSHFLWFLRCISRFGSFLGYSHWLDILNGNYGFHQLYWEIGRFTSGNESLFPFPSSSSTSQATWARIKLSSYLILLLGPLSPACGTWLEEHSPTKRITKSHNAWNPNNHHEIGTSPPLCQPST